MSTHPANDQLSAYLDGELEDTEAAALEAALDGDADLRAELDRLRGVQRLLRSHGPARAPAGFKERVMTAAREEVVIAPPWWRRPFGIPVEGVLIAAAAALVLIVALPKADAPGPEPEVAPAAAPEAKGKLGDPQQGEGLVDANPDRDEPLGLGAKGVGEGGGGTAEVDPTPTGKPSPKPKEGVEAKPVPSKEAPQVAKGQGGGTAEASTTDNAALPEQGAQGTDVVDPQMVSAGLMVELYTDNEGDLATIQAIVARHGGVIRTLANKPVTTGLLDVGETNLIIDVPNERATEMNKELSGLGATISTTKGGLTNGGMVKVPIRIVVRGTNPTEPEPPPNAARSKQMDDAYEAAETIDE